jgi:hypothetical protein
MPDKKEPLDELLKKKEKLKTQSQLRIIENYRKDVKFREQMEKLSDADKDRIINELVDFEDGRRLDLKNFHPVAQLALLRAYRKTLEEYNRTYHKPSD